MTHLLNPITIKNHRLPHRLVSPPICIGKAKDDGSVSDAVLSHYEALSHGGFFSLIVVPDSFVSEEGRTSRGQLSAASDDMIAGLTSLAETIKNNGTKVLLQLNHAGSCTSKNITGSRPLAPSEISNPRKGDFPRQLELQEIKSLLASFEAAALRGKSAGFHGIEIHSAHGYLLNQFYSPLTNHREDEYGGTLANRIRIHLEIIHAIRKAVGDDFIISLRLGALDYMDKGSSLEDALNAAQAFERAGIDLLSISGGMCGYTNPLDDSPGYFSKESTAIKAEINIPLVLTGGIRAPEDIYRLLEEEACDLVGVGRAALADPDWARNAITSL